MNLVSGNGTPGGASNETDIFVAKYESDGDLVWARAMGGSGIEEQANAVRVDSAGNVTYHSQYVTARF